MIGSDWIRKSGALESSSPIMRWAEDLHAATKAIKLTVTEDLHARVGIACLLALELEHKRFVAPKWEVVHVEGDETRAAQLRDALNEHMPRVDPIRFQVQTQVSLGTSRSLALERVLERIQSRIMSGSQLRPIRFLLDLSEVERVAAEALRMSQRLDRLDRAALPTNPGAATSATEEADRTPAKQSDPKPGPAQESVGYLSAKDIAAKLGVPEDALRKRLERLRRSRFDAFIENDAAKKGEARYLYDYAVAKPIADELKASMTASMLRPFSESGPT